MGLYSSGAQLVLTPPNLPQIIGRCASHSFITESFVFTVILLMRLRGAWY